MKREKLSFLAGIGLTVLLAVAAVLAVIAALKMNTTAPVAPTVPQAKPRAEEPTRTAACGLSFTVAAAPAPLSCDSLTLNPSGTTLTTAGGQTRQLTVTASGGTAPYAFTWVLTGTGQLSATTGQTVTWSAPNTLNTDQTWTIAATVTDSAGQTAAGDKCKTTLTFTNPPPSPSCNNTCTNSADCPNDLACVSGRCRNTACTSESDCQCPPPLKACNDTCLVKEECQAGMTCAGGRCRNVSCITAESCVCPVPVAPAPAAPAPAPAPAPVIVATHKTCQNNACVTVNGSGRDTCTSDAACQPKAAAPPIPQAGVSLPTIAILAGGIGLIIFALLAL